MHNLDPLSVLRELARLAGTEAAQGRVILAHLGNSTSLAAVHDGKPVDKIRRSILLILLPGIEKWNTTPLTGNNSIPDKGRVLTKLSEFWFDMTKRIVPNHVISTEVKDFPGECRSYWVILKDRSMIVIKTVPLPIECVVRGYLSGSGWEEYKETGKVCGIGLPKGLLESSNLEEPIFTLPPKPR